MRILFHVGTLNITVSVSLVPSTVLYGDCPYRVRGLNLSCFHRFCICTNPTNSLRDKLWAEPFQPRCVGCD